MTKKEECPGKNPRMIKKVTIELLMVDLVLQTDQLRVEHLLGTVLRRSQSAARFCCEMGKFCRECCHSRFRSSRWRIRCVCPVSWWISYYVCSPCRPQEFLLVSPNRRRWCLLSQPLSDANNKHTYIQAHQQLTTSLLLSFSIIRPFCACSRFWRMNSNGNVCWVRSDANNKHTAMHTSLSTIHHQLTIDFSLIPFYACSRFCLENEQQWRCLLSQVRYKQQAYSHAYKLINNSPPAYYWLFLNTILCL